VRIFRCDSCGHPVFFENVRCLHCGSDLAFLPDRLALTAIEPVPESTGGPTSDTPAAGPWQRKSPRRRDGRTYRLCHNNTQQHACNFAVPSDDPNPLCVSCRQTRILPDLSQPANQERWYRIEIAKRRLFYTLARLGLAKVVLAPGEQQGPVYEFLADLPGAPPVMTGHRNGVITLNIAEADDDERARRRVVLHEPYRTLLGHLRHESGHYYWDSLIRDAGRLDGFRATFGDESMDYGQALANHYAQGHDASQWQQDYVSAYATAHPWEDWAETWAHYLHMVDLMETAASYNTRVVVPGEAPEDAEEVVNPFAGDTDFDQLVSQWVPVTLLLNSLNRSLGQNDAYPFALTPGALRKLRYVHEVIEAARRPLPAAAAVPPPMPPVAEMADGAGSEAAQAPAAGAAPAEPTQA